MKKWTAICLVKCDDEPAQLSSLNMMFKEILSLRIPSEIAVLFWVQAPADIMTAAFYQVEALPAPDGDTKSRLVPLIPDEKDLKAEHCLLVTWGHGAAAGIYFDGVRPEEYSQGVVSMDTLGSAIKETFGLGGIDVVIMMNCYMQYFDTLYALWNADVKYTVASQYGLDFAGYNYKEIFGALYTSPDIQPRDLAKLATTSLKTSVKAGLSEDAAIFSSDLSVIPSLANAICRLGQELIMTTPLQRKKIQGAAVKERYIHTGFDLIDVFVFVKIIRDTLGPDWETATRQILDLRDHLIIAEYQGHDLSRPGINLGCSICVPRTADLHFFLNYIKKDARYASFFQRTVASHWQDFVVEYAKTLTAGPVITGVRPPEA